ncbi:MAG TPA: hypothetical protein VGM14_12220 [Streptosporangiaceae bacterium]
MLARRPLEFDGTAAVGPKERFTNLTGISCLTTTMCMASGFFRILSPNVFFGAVTELWKNGKWTLWKVFGVVTGFAAISCPTVSRCFADGYANAGAYNNALIKTWNGRKWTAQHPAQAAAAYPAAGLATQASISGSPVRVSSITRR